MSTTPRELEDALELDDDQATVVLAWFSN